MTNEPEYAVGWTRTLTGEHGYVASISKERFTVVQELDEAAHLSLDEATKAVEAINAFVGTHAYMVLL